MKVILTLLAVCFIGINAATIDDSSTNYEGLIDKLVNEFAELVKRSGIELKEQIDEIIFEPWQQVGASVDNIQQLSEENDECAAAEEEKIANVIADLHKALSVCRVVAVNSSAEIIIDVSRASQQLVFGGYSLLQNKRKCKKYNQAWLRNSCKARWSAQLGLYVKNGRKSLKTIKRSTSESIPAVLNDGKTCTHAATGLAVLELDNITDTITDCIAESEY